MATPSTHEITDLLLTSSGGDRGALGKLIPLVYRESHGLAQGYLHGECASHMLQTIAPRMVSSDWSLARAWFLRELSRGTGNDA